MKFQFTVDQRTYLCGVLSNLAASSPRKERRNIQRVAMKFVPQATHTFLKPSDRRFVLGLLFVGRSILEKELAKSSPTNTQPDGVADNTEPSLSAEQRDLAQKQLVTIIEVADKIAQARAA
jgi:hypothetical protein